VRTISKADPPRQFRRQRHLVAPRWHALAVRIGAHHKRAVGLEQAAGLLALIGVALGGVEVDTPRRQPLAPVDDLARHGHQLRSIAAAGRRDEAQGHGQAEIAARSKHLWLPHELGMTWPSAGRIISRSVAGETE